MMKTRTKMPSYDVRLSYICYYEFMIMMYLLIFKGKWNWFGFKWFLITPSPVTNKWCFGVPSVCILFLMCWVWIFENDLGRFALKCFVKHFVAEGTSQSCVLKTVSMSKMLLVCDWREYKCCPQHSSSGHINVDDIISIRKCMLVWLLDATVLFGAGTEGSPSKAARTGFWPTWATTWLSIRHWGSMHRK